MKKPLCLLVLALCLGLLWGCDSTPAPETAPGTDAPTQSATGPTEAPTQPEETVPPTQPTEVTQAPGVSFSDVKAMWLSQFDLTPIFRDGENQREESDFTARMAQVLDNVKNQGFNTVFLQIRPYADSMYPSEYFPMSAHVVGRTGGQAQYDPVEIIVRLARERNLSIHGWINPMRGMTEAEILLVGTEYALRRWYDDPTLRERYLIPVSGRLYLNPAYKEVADLIVAGAEEAMIRYGFDGLHMDDYFYPTTDPSFDALAYEAFGNGKSLADFRRGNLNLLVRRLYELTHSQGKIFGISPAGNADTVYNSQYADIYRWCAEDGYIDYICPQVYFGLEHGSFDFRKVCRTYQDMIRTDSVELIVGMTFGKAFSREDKWAGSGKDEWAQNRDVLRRCLEATRELERCQGVAVFCYQYFFDPATGAEIPETAQERANFVPLLQEITWN